MTDATVTQLWRFPVKSMGGSQVDRVRIDRRGVHADRLWAVRDVPNGVTASARRVPVLLGCSARYAAEPGADAGPGNAPAVVISLPDGREFAGDDPAVHDALSELVGREMRLVALPPHDDRSEHRMTVANSLNNFSPAQVRSDFGLDEAEPLPDTSVFSTRQIVTLARYSTPPGTFVDLSPVHLLSTASLRDLASGGAPYDVRRFRPNVLVDVEAPDREFPESAWVGGDVTVGKMVLRVTNPTIRCVVPTRPQPDLELDRKLTRQLAERTNRFLGIYADVATPGMVTVGDTVSVRLASPPGAVKRAATAAQEVATRGVQRLLEATVLRGRD
ncbi:molybdenum cofactor biosysynthesis protein [Mycolicibacterium arabiense]|uniref:Molybdenum cofactor biosysynthesis protein n=1 Tax=Mycolicibacterium arabiense TaxID=1286181 RepID=A0A7I7S211_9MYCO|nr:MOSC N-terminal beta barrel domain-containing protein [Mycolicibacterium arabiense]MCV7374894.1 MOSC domain-containing protein [Mycolicibacterium arabiense]BBY50948.1 molybdenum cofactor biosysynthesis protein [Mycolicibacterium arabiense]